MVSARTNFFLLRSAFCDSYICFFFFLRPIFFSHDALLLPPCLHKRFECVPTCVCVCMPPVTVEGTTVTTTKAVASDSNPRPSKLHIFGGRNFFLIMNLLCVCYLWSFSTQQASFHKTPQTPFSSFPPKSLLPLFPLKQTTCFSFLSDPSLSC